LQERSAQFSPRWALPNCRSKAPERSLSLTSLLLDEPSGSPLMGVQEPRIWLSPEAKSSAGQEAIDLAAACGLILDPWQELCLHEALKESDELVQLESGAWVKKWAASSFGLVVSRQNGKGSILEALELAGLILFGERLIIHSAHEFKTAVNGMERLESLIA